MSVVSPRHQMLGGSSRYRRVDLEPELVFYVDSVCVKDPKEAKEVLIEMAKTAAEALGAAFKGEESLVGLDPETDTTWGLAREEMGKKPLVGTVKRYDTHLFVIWKTPADWPKNADQGDEASLPVALAKALSERKNSIVGKVRNPCR